ncbi:MAG: response regulator [Calditrichaeota bacterium]|nr:MAG: response regulator [Calditrichota bacterium]
MAKGNIICVDDERQVLAALKKDIVSLEEDYEISECETASEAWDLIEEIHRNSEMVNLIICDHIMPGENGVQFLTRLYKDERFQEIKKILLTGLATHQETIQAINEAHIDLYLEKPWDADDLLNKIKKLL